MKSHTPLRLNKHVDNGHLLLDLRRGGVFRKRVESLFADAINAADEDGYETRERRRQNPVVRSDDI